MIIEVAEISQISELITSGSRGWAAYYADSGALFLRMTNLPKDGIKLLLDDKKYVQLPEGSNEGKRTAVRDGDILISITAELGKIGFVEGFANKEAYVNQHICLIRPTPSEVNPKFLAYYLSSPSQRYLLNSLNDSGAKSGLNLSAIAKFRINLPDINLQEHAVYFLEHWEAAIEKTEALIDAKERQFRWLQNELMRKNSQAWTLKSLKDISSIKKGQQVNRDTLDEVGDYPVWNGGISPSGYTDKSNAKAGAITISEGGNSCGFVNFCKVDFWLGGHCYAIENLDSSINPDFLFFFLKSMERKIMQLRVGSGLPNIQRKDIEKLQIYFPALEKQKSITTSLSIAKKEISLLKELVVQYRAQKRGLMQRLLI